MMNENILNVYTPKDICHTFAHADYIVNPNVSELENRKRIITKYSLKNSEHYCELPILLYFRFFLL